jgi:DNA-binding beta-propeller fold protein YncE
VWVSNSGNASVSAFSSSGAALTGSPYTGSGITTPLAIAINPK